MFIKYNILGNKKLTIGSNAFVIVRNKAIKERIKERKIDIENLTWFGVQCVCLRPRLH